jgi:K+-sensing histidine kinase KdpD
VNAEYSRSLEKVSDIMVASTSHDMRTPLNTIVNMHTLMESYVKNNSKFKKWI